MHVRALPAILFVVGAGLLLGACGSDGGNSAGDEGEELQTVRFEEPASEGEDPFTAPVDVQGKKFVKLPASGSGPAAADTEAGQAPSSGPGSGEAAEAQGPFGGSGSDRVCDRNLLYKALKVDPAKRREWARVLGIDPSLKSVRNYIAQLHPVTLTRDTRVTNHTYTDGQAVPLQSILAAGTTVLVDKSGRPVVRCRCGNPLAPAIHIPEAKCIDCPPDYTPPEPCNYTEKIVHKKVYRRGYYSNSGYDEVFKKITKTGPFRDYYVAYPDPPPVEFINIYEPPEPEPEPVVVPAPPPEPAPVAPAPPPTTTTPPPAATTTTDICSDGLDNEGVPGLIDGDDPNCGGTPPETTTTTTTPTTQTP